MNDEGLSGGVAPSKDLTDERYPLEAVLAAIQEGGRLVDVSGVDVDLLAYLVVAVHTRTERPCVIITPGDSEARRVAADLRFFTGEERVALLPTIEASPYGDLSPDRSAVMELLGELARLLWDHGGDFTVAAIETFARRAVPPDVVLDHSFEVRIGDELNRHTCLRALADAGYHAVSAVEDVGTFAVRGSILDVFPPHLDAPVRVELWGDEVESLRTFDSDNQRTVDPLPGGVLLLPPVREELMGQVFRDRARRGIIEAGVAVGQPTRMLQPMLDDLVNGIPFMGVEGFRPAFYEALVPLTTYLPKDAIVFVLDPMGTGDRLRGAWDRLVRGYEGAVEDHTPALPAERHALNPSEVVSALAEYAQIRAHVLQMVDEIGAVDGPASAIEFKVLGNRDLSYKLEQARGDKEPLKPLAEAVRHWTGEGARVVLAARQETQLDRMERLLKGYGVAVQRGTERPRAYLHPPKAGEAGAVLVRGDVGGGFRLLSHGFALVTDEEVFGRKVRRTRARKRDAQSPFVQSFRELEPNDFVVHADHGVGRYLGLKKLELGGRESDFLVIAFAGKDKLFLPVYKLGRLQKHVSGGKSSPRVDKLGGTTWQKVRAKAKASAEEDAYALLDLYARRELAKGYAFSTPDDYYRAFEATFPFTETVDQARAIEEILADMSRPRPMDRLLCGDVGFGKTEVALRATMKAALDGKQVVVLVPTTVLALQHYKTFCTRFADYPVTVGLFSRLNSKEELKEKLKHLKLGKIDIAIGTHRLLSKDVKYKDLGLLVLDEEHRFGVRHKERLKEMRSNVDVLAMTATPIPRTLQMSLNGVRDLSVITTPPMDRLSVRTFVCRATDEVVREAILRELGRGGQVFFVHNRVQSIEARKAWLISLVPEARIVVGHGQMDPKKLERVMIDFTEGRFNVLLATTIIESGIDIPNANTMLLDHADQFGLAQLYQLRGRVGRSKERGYCYLLVPSQATLSGEARKRLAVIQKFTELGSGFHVASHDMELRGAGELLGTSQKGHMQAVGLDLYAQLIEDAVRTLRGQAPPVEFDPDVNLQVTARIPEEYVPDTHLRLMLYKRLANGNDEEDVLAVADEMLDRFGEPPGPVLNLIEVMRIRTLAKLVGLKSVDHAPDHVRFTFDPQSPMPVSAIIGLVTTPGTRFRAPADFKLTYHFDAGEKRETVATVRMCLQRLAEFVPEEEG